MKHFFLVLFVSIFFIGFSTSAQNRLQVRVLTFNVMHGATINRDFNIKKITDIINRLQPDLVALQELDFNTGRSRNYYYDLASELGYLTHMCAIFGKSIPYDGGSYGNGILSKTPFIETKNIALPMLQPGEPRGLLQAVTVLSSGDTIRFISTHFDVNKDNTNRLAQVKTALGWIQKSNYPIIFAGDLNDTPQSEVIKNLERWMENTEAPDTKTLTFSSVKPDRKIDYIFTYPKKKWKVISTEAICDSVASDHRAYFAVLENVSE